MVFPRARKANMPRKLRRMKIRNSIFTLLKNNGSCSGATSILPITREKTGIARAVVDGTTWQIDRPATKAKRKRFIPSKSRSGLQTLIHVAP